MGDQPEGGTYPVPRDGMKASMGTFSSLWTVAEGSHSGKMVIFSPVLNLLVCALGALAVDDLLSLTQPEGLDSWTLKEALRPLGRFIIAMGDGQQKGYVFSHSRLNHWAKTLH